MTTLLHIADLHAGPPFLPNVAEALVGLAESMQPDALLCAGDLVEWPEQRSGWETAQRLLARLPTPQLCVPGNHDLPWFNPIARWRRPFARFAAVAGPSLAPTLYLAPGTASEVLCVGLASAKRSSLDRGHLTPAQLTEARAAFASAPRVALRVAVFHHGLRELPFTRFVPNAIRGRHRLGSALCDLGVDLALTGHNHFPHTERLAFPAGTLIWSQAGTACSRRFRNPEYPRCSVTRIQVAPDSLTLEVYGCPPDSDEFTRESSETYPRPARD
ncbi:MAG: metallophosphoesterase family protein [Planctomycetota bacterium]